MAWPWVCLLTLALPTESIEVRDAATLVQTVVQKTWPQAQQQEAWRASHVAFAMGDGDGDREDGEERHNAFDTAYRVDYGEEDVPLSMRRPRADASFTDEEEEEEQHAGPSERKKETEEEQQQSSPADLTVEAPAEAEEESAPTDGAPAAPAAPAAASSSPSSSSSPSPPREAASGGGEASREGDRQPLEAGAVVEDAERLDEGLGGAVAAEEDAKEEEQQQPQGTPAAPAEGSPAVEGAPAKATERAPVEEAPASEQPVSEQPGEAPQAAAPAPAPAPAPAQEGPRQWGAAAEEEPAEEAAHAAPRAAAHAAHGASEHGEEGSQMAVHGGSEQPAERAGEAPDPEGEPLPGTRGDEGTDAHANRVEVQQNDAAADGLYAKLELGTLVLALPGSGFTNNSGVEYYAAGDRGRVSGFMPGPKVSITWERTGRSYALPSGKRLGELVEILAPKPRIAVGDWMEVLPNLNSYVTKEGVTVYEAGDFCQVIEVIENATDRIRLAWRRSRQKTFVTSTTWQKKFKYHSRDDGTPAGLDMPRARNSSASTLTGLDMPRARNSSASTLTGLETNASLDLGTLMKAKTPPPAPENCGDECGDAPYQLGDLGRVSGLGSGRRAKASINITWERTGRTTSVAREQWPEFFEKEGEAPRLKVGDMLQALPEQTSVVDGTTIYKPFDYGRVVEIHPGSTKTYVKILWRRSRARSSAGRSWPRRFRLLKPSRPSGSVASLSRHGGKGGKPQPGAADADAQHGTAHGSSPRPARHLGPRSAGSHAQRSGGAAMRGSRAGASRAAHRSVKG